MKAKYNQCPFTRLYEALREAINFYYYDNGERYKKDGILEQILAEREASDPQSIAVQEEEICENEFSVLLCAFSEGSPKNAFFDYFQFYGYNYLIVYVKYFESVLSISKVREKSEVELSEMEKPLRDIIGYSSLVYGLNKIFKFGIELISPKIDTSISTIYSDNTKNLSIIMAVKLLNEFVTLEEEDVIDELAGTGLSFEQVMNLSKYPITSLSLGIKLY